MGPRGQPALAQLATPRACHPVLVVVLLGSDVG